MIIDVRNLNVTYDAAENQTRAVKDASFGVPENSFCALIGESGSGKSTIITAILGLLPDGSVTSGEILYRGKNILGVPESETARLRQREIALVPQGAMNSFTPVMTIGAHLRELLELHMKTTGSAAEKRAKELLDAVELPWSAASRYPHELSGGQKQRAAIALAVSCDPKIVLADEPTTALDVVTQAAVLKLLERLRRENKITILLVTHDLLAAASVAQKLFVMKNGTLAESGFTQDIVKNPKTAAAKALVSAMLWGEA